MEKRLCLVSVKLNGIYEWGTGYSKESGERWNEFWNEVFPFMKKIYYWELLPSKDRSFGGCDYLVTTSGSIYLHPMGFDTVLKNSGGHSSTYIDGVYVDEYFNEIKELEEILTELCDYCKATYTLERTEKVVEF